MSVGGPAHGDGSPLAPKAASWSAFIAKVMDVGWKVRIDMMKYDFMGGMWVAKEWGVGVGIVVAGEDEKKSMQK